MDESSRCSSQVTKIFSNVAYTKNSPLTIIENLKKIYGVQFHPEVNIPIMENKYLKIFIFNL